MKARSLDSNLGHYRMNGPSYNFGHAAVAVQAKRPRLARRNAMTSPRPDGMLLIVTKSCAVLSCIRDTKRRQSTDNKEPRFSIRSGRQLLMA